MNFMKTIILDGEKFNDLDSFYDEVQRIFCPEFPGFGRNLDAFNDVLRGGFGVFEEGEPVTLVWRSSEKSRKDLGHEAEANLLRVMMTRAHSSNLPSINERLLKAEKNEGPTLFDELVSIIRNSENMDRINLIFDKDEAIKYE
jgi:RNAse (barnase) inhibitor barstar